MWELVNAKEATLGGGTSPHAGIVMLFFVSYIILVSYIMSSVVLAILIEKFEESRAQESGGEKRGMEGSRVEQWRAEESGDEQRRTEESRVMPCSV